MSLKFLKLSIGRSGSNTNWMSLLMEEDCRMRRLHNMIAAALVGLVVVGSMGVVAGKVGAVYNVVEM